VSGDQLVWIDGALRPVDQPNISHKDRGFLLGDGLFETILARDGRPVRLERHLRRLREGLRILQIDLPRTDEDLSVAIQSALEANGLIGQAVVRMSVSRGIANTRGLPPDPNGRPTLVIDASEYHGYPASVYEQGWRVGTSTITRNDQSPTHAFKTLSNLDHVLARLDVMERGLDEALIVNTRLSYVGASSANLFVAREGRLVTPPRSEGVLMGTMRGFLLEELLPVLGIPAEEAALSREVLLGADEVLLTNALLGVAPVVEVDARQIGEGVPGPMARRLREALS